MEGGRLKGGRLIEVLLIILFILNAYTDIIYCNMFTYTPPGNKLLLHVASVVK